MGEAEEAVNHGTIGFGILVYVYKSGGLRALENEGIEEVRISHGLGLPLISETVKMMMTAK